MQKQLDLFDNSAATSMIFLNGSEVSFRCDAKYYDEEFQKMSGICGCNVFAKLPPKEADPPGSQRYRCNACKAEYIGE